MLRRGTYRLAAVPASASAVELVQVFATGMEAGVGSRSQTGAHIPPNRPGNHLHASEWEQRQLCDLGSSAVRSLVDHFAPSVEPGQLVVL